VEPVIERLGKLTEKAAQDGFVLLHENEVEIVGDTPERCLRLMRGVDHPNLRFIWDSANFVQVGIAQVVDKYWDLLRSYTSYIHIKDALLENRQVTPAGEGDGQIPELLRRLNAEGYSGVLAVEPHLFVEGRSGHSGVAGMTTAVNALRQVMAKVGLS
jgi:sugar phosphate isomerase/epimerase